MTANFLTLENLYLSVPFDQKDEVKELGAKWDRNNKLWYIPTGLEPLQFRSWWSFLAPAFREKDEIKKKGARYHPGIKAWYVPADRDFDEFRTWWPKDCRQYIFNDRFVAYTQVVCGGQSRIFFGRDLTDNAHCAIKLFDIDEDDGDNTEGFERELDALMQLNHPNILPIWDWGRHEPTGQYFTVSPWMRWTFHDMFVDRQRVYREVYSVVCKNYETDWSEDEFVELLLKDDNEEDAWLEAYDDYLGEILEGLNHAASHSIIHRDIKPGNIFINVSYNDDVAPDLDHEGDIQKRFEALLCAGKQSRYVTYDDIAYVQGAENYADIREDFVTRLQSEDIDIRDNLSEQLFIADFGASKNLTLEGKKNKTMVLLRTEPWTPPRTDTELFFERTWDGYAWGVLAIAVTCDEIPEAREDIERLLNGPFKKTVGENLWEFVSRVVHVEADQRPSDIESLTEEVARLNLMRRKAISG